MMEKMKFVEPSRFTDPDAADPRTIIVDWGDGTVDAPVAFVSGGTRTHTYLNNPVPHPSASGTYSINVTITDSGNAAGTGNTSITVSNVTPGTIVITPSPSATINEGDTLSLSGTFVDGSPTASSDDHALHIQWGDGATDDIGTFSSGTGLGAGVLSYGPITHTYTDLKSPFGAASAAETITVQVKDEDTAIGPNTKGITINNVAPTLVTAPATLILSPGCIFTPPALIPPPPATWTCSIRVVATWTDPGTEGSTYSVTVSYQDTLANVLTTTTVNNVSSPATIDNLAVSIPAANLPYNICTTVTDHNTGVSNQVCSPFTFNAPPFGTVITGIATYAILTLQRGGFRPIELLIGGLVAVIGASYLIELLIVPPDWAAIGLHAVVPRLDGVDALTLAVGIFGATVMPHAIYLHSGLTQDRIVPRNDGERRKLVCFSNREVVLALGLAGLVNMAMLTMAAAVFHDGVHDDIASIETAYRTLIPLMGIGAAAVFMISLIASGLSSSAVGTMAGQVIMQGYLRRRIPVFLRRAVTMAPALLALALGVNPSRALVISQVILSFGIPFALIPLVVFCRDRALMGSLVNRRGTTMAATAVVGLIVSLNGFLLWRTLGA